MEHMVKRSVGKGVATRIERVAAGAVEGAPLRDVQVRRDDALLRPRIAIFARPRAREELALHKMLEKRRIDGRHILLGHVLLEQARADAGPLPRKPDRIARVEGSHHGHPCEIERHHRFGESQRRLLTVLLSYGAHTIHLRGSLEHARGRERPENTHAPTIFVIAWLHIVVVACHLGG